MLTTIGRLPRSSSGTASRINSAAAKKFNSKTWRSRSGEASLGKAAHCALAGVVDEDVQAAECLTGAFERRAPDRRVGDVANHSFRTAPERTDLHRELFKRVGPAGDENDGRTPLRQLQCDRSADAA
jgi:hypothetical protein